MSKIRVFNRDDCGAVRDLILTTIEQSYAPVYPPRAVQFFKDFHPDHKIIERSQTGTVLVVEEGGALLGTGTRVGHEIFAVFVHPGAQGSGLGQALMDTLETDACKAGVDEIILSVSLPSRRFYERLGYKITDEHARDLGGGEVLRFWTARKSISAVG